MKENIKAVITIVLKTGEKIIVEDNSSSLDRSAHYTRDWIHDFTSVDGKITYTIPGSSISHKEYISLEVDN